MIYNRYTAVCKKMHYSLAMRAVEARPLLTKLRCWYETVKNCSLHLLSCRLNNESLKTLHFSGAASGFLSSIISDNCSVLSLGNKKTKCTYKVIKYQACHMNSQ